MLIKNGDLPANPTIYADLAPNGQREIYCDQAWLTKREYFAALAMQGMLNGMMCNADSRHLALISEKSVKAADALLAELEKSK